MFEAIVTITNLPKSKDFYGYFLYDDFSQRMSIERPSR